MGNKESYASRTNKANNKCNNKINKCKISNKNSIYTMKRRRFSHLNIF